MVEIPDRLACLFSGSVTEAGDSYSIEVPEDELDAGAITAGETYRVVILEDSAPAGSDDHDGPSNAAASVPSEPPVSRGETREVTIETLGDQGDGIAKIERGYVLIVPDAQPDDEVTVEIRDARENFAFAEIHDQSEISEQ